MTSPVPFQPSVKGDDLMLFALDGNLQFGEQVSQWLGIAISPHEEREFPDGEHKTRPLINVRGRDVFVIHSLHADHRQSCNDKLCRLLFFIGSLKDAAAARVTAITPYLAYARKDRKSKTRDPVTTRYVATMFEAVGADAVVTMDVHNLAAYQNAFRCRTENLEANTLFVAYFKPLLEKRQTVVVSPDAGGVKRAEQFRQRLSQAIGRPVGTAFAEKYRSSDVVSGDMLIGDVKGKDAIIIDDLVSSGTTLARAAKACRALGAERVFAAATHGLFMGEANAVLADPALERVVTTDTVPPFRLADGPLKSKVDVLSSAGMFAEAIHRMHIGGSITDLLES